MPEIAVEREPKPLFHIVTQVSFERDDGFLRLSICAGKECIVRKELGVRGEKPHRRVSIEDPMAPALRIAEFWFEGPAVGAIVDQLRSVVLTRRSQDHEAHAQDGLLLPRLILLYGHCRAAFK